MSGSLLRCAGLEDLVTGSLEDYERAALDAARDARRLQEFRMRLAANRGVNPLFDTRALLPASGGCLRRNACAPATR